MAFLWNAISCMLIKRHFKLKGTLKDYSASMDVRAHVSSLNAKEVTLAPRFPFPLLSVMWPNCCFNWPRSGGGFMEMSTVMTVTSNTGKVKQSHSTSSDVWHGVAGCAHLHHIVYFQCRPWFSSLVIKTRSCQTMGCHTHFQRKLSHFSYSTFGYKCDSQFLEHSLRYNTTILTF